MIKRCLICDKEFKTFPSRIKMGLGKYCSHKCFISVNAKAFLEGGKKSRFRVGDIPFSQAHPEVMRRGVDHPLWRGEKVSYRGLHYWLRRKLGIPMECTKCGKGRTGPKSIQWANIDGGYRRVITDYIAMCASCHKLHDLALKS